LKSAGDPPVAKQNVKGTHKRKVLKAFKEHLGWELTFFVLCLRPRASADVA
jgi:hypothetical protein